VSNLRMGYEKSEYCCISEGNAWTWNSCKKCPIYNNCPAMTMNAEIIQCDICQEELVVGKDYKKRLDQVIQAAKDIGAKDAGYLCNVCKDKMYQAKVIQM